VLRIEIESQSPVITLGFNYSQMHDSFACIARDGELLFAVSEERISRIKHDAGFPHNPIRACLDFAGVHPDQLDVICVSCPVPGRLLWTDLKSISKGQHQFDNENTLNSAHWFVSMSHQNGGFKQFTYHFGPTRARFRFVVHHLAHAISAYSNSGFDNAAVIVDDAAFRGDVEN
jgi:carbamoyltransferase